MGIQKITMDLYVYVYAKYDILLIYYSILTSSREVEMIFRLDFSVRNDTGIEQYVATRHLPEGKSTWLLYFRKVFM